MNDRKDKLEASDLEVKPAKSWVKSFALHIVLFVLLVATWRFSEPVKEIPQPRSIAAHVASAQELEPLRERKRQEEAAKQARVQKQKEREQALKQKRAREAEKRKQAEAKKQQLAKEKALIAKRKAEQARKEEVAKRAADQRRKEAEEEQRRAKALAEQQALEQKEKAAREKEALAEQQRRREDALAQRFAASQESSNRNPTFSEAELSEKDKYVLEIRSRIENRWHIPPNTRGLTVGLRLSLLPTGELNKVELTQSSGNKALDQSALTAVKSVSRFPVPRDSKLFEAYFRQFSMNFSPSDL